MPIIALIDDRAENRTTIRHIFEKYLPGGWECLDFAPLDDVQSYRDFIVDEDIAVLVLDEKLHEEAQNSETHVNYNGHEVALELRKSYPEYPIHIVTAYKDDDELEENGATIDSIWAREDFSDMPDKIVPKILRSGMRFLETNEYQLREYSELAEKFAIGGLSKGEAERLSALRQKMNIQFSELESGTILDLVGGIESGLQQLDELLSDIEKDMSNN